MSVAGAWANARVDQPEPPGQRKPSVCEAPGLVESRAAAHLWLGRGRGTPVSAPALAWEECLRGGADA